MPVVTASRSTTSLYALDWEASVLSKPGECWVSSDQDEPDTRVRRNRPQGWV